MVSTKNFKQVKSSKWKISLPMQTFYLLLALIAWVTIRAFGVSTGVIHEGRNVAEQERPILP